MSAALHAIDRARYRARQNGFALWLGAVIQVWHAMAAPRLGLGRPPRRAIAALRRRFQALLAADLANVARGVYPKEVLFELSVVDLLRHFSTSFTEGPRVIRRARRNAYDDLPRGVDLSPYPPYYRRTFHWQTDGWLSDRSAKLYDTSVEVLFGGTADVMRRMTLPWLWEALRDEPAPRVLDVACGTGRFLRTVRKALPRAELYGIDLSPFYVERGRRLRGKDATLVAGNAEALPWPAGAFDGALSVFLFHELPRDARRNVMREALRVLKPGGRFVVCDSAQLGDSGELAFFLEAFPRLYHEPYHKGYLRDDLGAALAEVGFEVIGGGAWLVSKTVVARKPL